MVHVTEANENGTEFAEFWDAGAAFYVTDFWSIWDIGIIATGLAFFIARMIGLARRDCHIMDIAFDILSVEALFLVPRYVSIIAFNLPH